MGNKHNPGCGCCDCVVMRSGQPTIAEDFGWADWYMVDSSDDWILDGGGNKIPVTTTGAGGGRLLLEPGDRARYEPGLSGTSDYYSVCFETEIFAGSQATLWFAGKMLTLQTTTGIPQTGCGDFDTYCLDIESDQVERVMGCIRGCGANQQVFTQSWWPQLRVSLFYENTWSIVETVGTSAERKIVISNDGTIDVVVKWVTGIGEAAGGDSPECRPNCEDPPLYCPECCDEKYVQWQAEVVVTGQDCVVEWVEDDVDQWLGSCAGPYQRIVHKVTYRGSELSGTYIYSTGYDCSFCWSLAASEATYDPIMLPISYERTTANYEFNDETDEWGLGEETYEIDFSEQPVTLDITDDCNGGGHIELCVTISPAIVTSVIGNAPCITQAALHHATGTFFSGDCQDPSEDMCAGGGDPPTYDAGDFIGTPTIACCELITAVTATRVVV